MPVSSTGMTTCGSRASRPLQAQVKPGDLAPLDAIEAVLRHVRSVNPGPLDGDAIARLFERIIDEARRAERAASARLDDLAQ